jgi:hypothetical protein
MQILPSHPMAQYVLVVELNGEPVNATFIDMETGRIQYWNAGEQVEGFGKVRILLESKDNKVSLDPAMSLELDKLLEEFKQNLATMDPEDRAQVYEEHKGYLSMGAKTTFKD